MSDKIAAAVVRNVDRVRRLKGMKRQDIAAKLGITPASLSAMLAKGKSMSTGSVQSLAKALGVNPCELLCPKSS